MATKTAVIVLYEKEVLIWAIPPLSPQPLDFFDHHPTHIPPLFIIPIPVDIEVHPDTTIQWNTISRWYFGSSQPLYCDLLCRYTIHRFQIMIEPDLSTASLYVINTPEITRQDFTDVFLPEYMICGDALVSDFTISNYIPDTHQFQYQPRLYTGLTTANGIISHGGPAANMLLPEFERGSDWFDLFPCPASGRFVLRVCSGGDSDSVAVLDFF